MDENERAAKQRAEPGKVLDQLAHGVIGAAIEVHTALGPGYQEAVYEEALCVELELRGIPFRRQAEVVVDYKGRTVGRGTMDLLVRDALVVELKAVTELAPVHKAQVISYLKASQCRLGLLINFHVAALRDGIKRIVLT